MSTSLLVKYLGSCTKDLRSNPHSSRQLVMVWKKLTLLCSVLSSLEQKRRKDRISCWIYDSPTCHLPSRVLVSDRQLLELSTSCQIGAHTHRGAIATKHYTRHDKNCYLCQQIYTTNTRISYTSVLLTPYQQHPQISGCSAATNCCEE